MHLSSLFPACLALEFAKTNVEMCLLVSYHTETQPSAAMEDAYLEFSRHVSLLKQSLFRQNIVSFVQEEQARKLDLSVQLVKKGILWISFHRREFCGSGRRRVKLLLRTPFWSSIFNKDILSLEQCVDAL